MIDLVTIQHDILNPSLSVSSILLKAKVLASQLGNDEFLQWVEQELNGYQRADESLPTYRHIPCTSYGNFVGPFGRTISNFPIPNSNLSEEMRPYASHLYLTEPVSSLEQNLTGSEDIGVPWPGDWIKLVQTEILQGYSLIRAWKPVTTATIRSVLNSVRSRLLDFVLEIGKILPEGEKTPNQDNVPSQGLSNMVQNIIYGGNPVIATGAHIQQTVAEVVVQSTDISDLLEQLRKLGIPEIDVLELEKAVDLDGKRSKDDGFGDKVKDWLAKATQRIATDLWNIGTETAPILVAKFLANYYGWS